MSAHHVHWSAPDGYAEIPGRWQDCAHCTRPRKPLVHIPGHDNLPPNLTADERKAATMPDVPVSPTGAPVLPSKGWAFLILSVLMAAASAVALGQPDIIPGQDIDQQVSTVIIAILGFLSPGLRKK